MKRFQHKTVLVTGASRGIGRATAIEFAKEGACVFGVYCNNHEMAASLSDEIGSFGGECIMIQADISDPAQVEKNIVPKLNSLDILINNAGIVFDVSFNDTTPEEWKRTFDVNVLGAFLCTKYLAPVFNTGGAIVNVSSIAGLKDFSNEWMAYDGSKGWLTAITHSMAQEFAKKNVRVNAVAPGYIDTDMNTDLPKEYIQQTLDQTYLKRIGQPIEIANTILFLASDKASFVTGSILVADGGMGR